MIGLSILGLAGIAMILVAMLVDWREERPTRNYVERWFPEERESRSSPRRIKTGPSIRPSRPSPTQSS